MIIKAGTIKADEPTGFIYDGWEFVREETDGPGVTIAFYNLPDLVPGKFYRYPPLMEIKECCKE